MAKRNKLRYQSQGNVFPTIMLTGKFYVRHIDIEADQSLDAEKGDLHLFLSTDSLLYNTHVGDYEAMGNEGYLKADVFDGRGWKPLSLEEFFPGREQYFGKRERPGDTVAFCKPVFAGLKGVEVMRTYREHYVLKVAGADPTDAKKPK